MDIKYIEIFCPKDDEIIHFKELCETALPAYEGTFDIYSIDSVSDFMWYANHSQINKESYVMKMQGTIFWRLKTIFNIGEK